MQDRPNELFVKGCRRGRREAPHSPSSPAQLLFLASPKCVPANTPKWQRLSPKATFSFYESCLNLSRIYGLGGARVGCHKGCNVHRHLFPHISNLILCFSLRDQSKYINIIVQQYNIYILLLLIVRGPKCLEPCTVGTKIEPITFILSISAQGAMAPFQNYGVTVQ